VASRARGLVFQHQGTARNSAGYCHFTLIVDRHLISRAHASELMGAKDLNSARLEIVERARGLFANPIEKSPEYRAIDRQGKHREEFCGALPSLAELLTLFEMHEIPTNPSRLAIATQPTLPL
jgi:hypothetical protein